ncbi:imm11 family protein [Tenacibaculum sp. TC6]|uniref:imm11 family protein n=1 Tax=Tenacibaculum sp. TC6 TaxID=3423223 RepID=UPI003D36029A
MAINKKYYSIYAKNLKEVSSANSIGNDKLDYELIPELKNLDEMPFEFELKMLTHSKRGIIISDDTSLLKQKWFDYQYNDLAWPIFSERLMKVIETSLNKNENLSWIKCIINSNEEKRTYFIPKFSKKPDLLDTNKTIYVPGTNHIIKPYFSLSKAQKYAVFPKPSTFWEIPTSIVVNQQVKEAIEKQRFPEIEFDEILISES